MEQLTGLGYGIIALGVIIGIGVVLLLSLGKSVSNCPTGYVYVDNSTASDSCCYQGNITCTGGNYSAPSSATTNLKAIQGYIGTGTGGLATWLPVVIVMVIGLWFLGAFLVRRGKQA